MDFELTGKQKTFINNIVRLRELPEEVSQFVTLVLDGGVCLESQENYVRLVGALLKAPRLLEAEEVAGHSIGGVICR